MADGGDGDSLALLESLLDNIPAMVVVREAGSLRCLRINRAGEELLGRPREAVVGTTDYGRLFPVEGADFEAQDRAALASTARPEPVEETIESSPLGRRVLLTRRVVVRRVDGTPRLLIALSEDITERKTAQQSIETLSEQLEWQLGELERANKELEAFNYSVSHDLRSPLNVILSWATILEDARGALTAEESKGFRAIKTGVEKTTDLLDHLMAFSRYGRQEIARGPIEMSELARTVAAELRSADPAGKAEWVLADLRPAYGDAALVRQILVNLLSNALKYSSRAPKPRIEVGGAAVGGKYAYFVRDNGAGFDMARATKLFEPFQRMHTNAEFPGTGIGLAIVSQIIRRHHGRIWAESKPGEGTTFRFTLPPVDD
jgi:PAS domain S-box-containing protein